MIVSITQKPPEGFGLSNEQAFEAVSELSNGRSWNKPEADCYLDQEVGELLDPLLRRPCTKLGTTQRTLILKSSIILRATSTFPMT